MIVEFQIPKDSYDRRRKEDLRDFRIQIVYLLAPPMFVVVRRDNAASTGRRLGPRYLITD